MKIFKSIMLFFAVAFTFIMNAAAQNVSINVLTQNSGQVNLNGTVFVEVTIANTSSTTAVPNYKLRPQISIPTSIVNIPATGHILPAGWTIISNAAGVIRVSNGTDQIPANTARTILIAIHGDVLGGPQTVSGNLLFSNGVAPGSASGPATVGDVTADNTSSSTVEVIPAAACNIGVTASAGTIVCNAGTTTLTATATGASGAVEYSLNGGAFQAGNTFIVNAAGSPYTVTTREASNTTCTATATTVSVTEPTAIAASASAGTIACNAGTTTLTVTATGGTGALQYSLNGGAFQAGNTFAVNFAGSPYTVSVKDANLCTATTNTVTVTQPTVITASVSAGTIACFSGTTTLTVTVTGGTGALGYSLNGGAFQAGNTFTVNAAGSPYTVTVKDANLCTATTNTVTVTQPTVLSGTASSTPVTTTGGSDGTATAVPSGGTSPYTYLWSPGGQTTITATGLTAGSYTVTVTDSKGCTTTATTTVGSPACNITASASAGTITCFGGTAILTVIATGTTGAVEYSLNGGAFQAGNTFTVNAAGSPYTVNVKDANLCTATTNTVTVTQPTAITASASAGTINCFGGTTTLTVTASGGTGALEYSLNGGAFQAGNTFTVNTSGSPYTVSVKDANLCTATTNTVMVTQPTVLSATATATPVTIFGGSDGTATTVPTGGTAPYTYLWSPGGQTTITATGLTSGSYTVTVTDSKGCTITATITVGSPGTSVLTATVVKNNLSACGGTNDGSITVTATGGTAPYTYSWTGESGSNHTSFTAGNVSSITGLNYGYYNVTVTDASSNTVTISNIHIEFAFAVYITSSGSISSSCGNTGSILLYGNSGVQPYTYSINGTTYQVSNSFTGLTAGVYTGYVKDAAGCISQKSITIGSAAPITVTTFVRAATSCANDGSIEIFRSGGIPSYTYSLDNITYVNNNKFLNLAPGSYTAWVKDSKGCTGSQTVTVVQGVALSVTASKTNSSTCVNNGTIQANASGGVAPYTFSLNAGAFQVSNSFTGLAAGVYALTVKDSKGCLGNVIVTIESNPITVTASAVAASSCASSNGSIKLFRTGGFGPYMYSINGNTYQANNTFTSLSAGTYTGYVKDSRTCVGMVTIVVGPTCLPSPIASNMKTKVSVSINTSLKIQAYPNPSVTAFTLVLEGFNSKEKVSISVTDLLGRVIYQTADTGKFQYEFGKNFIAGMYNVQVVQGKVKKNLKIVKE